MPKPIQQEQSPRSLPLLIQEFELSAGNFQAFSKSLTPREKRSFQGWLAEMRVQPQTISPAIYTLEDIHDTWHAATAYAKGLTPPGRSKPVFSQKDWVQSLRS